MKRTDLKGGNYYTIYHPQTNTKYIFFMEKDFNSRTLHITTPNVRLNMNNNKMDNFANKWSSCVNGSFSEDYKHASKEEIEYLKECITQDRLVEYEEFSKREYKSLYESLDEISELINKKCEENEESENQEFKKRKSVHSNTRN